MKQRILLAIMLLMVICSFSRAKEAYAVYTSANSTLTFYYDDDKASREGDKYSLNTEQEIPRWYEDGKKFETVVFAHSFSDYRPTTTFMWFGGQDKLENIVNIDYLKTDSVRSMEEMFVECDVLKELDLHTFNTGKVTTMKSMFYGCDSLKVLDTYGWDTSKVTTMRYMFCDCISLKELDLSGWNTGNVMDMSNMFYHCESLTELDINHWDTSNVRTLKGMFACCTNLKSIDLHRWDTGKVINIDYLFNECSAITSINLSGWDARNVYSMISTFDSCESLESINLNGWRTSKVEDISHMFFDCQALTSVNLNGWDTSNMKNISNAFQYCYSLKSLSLGSWDTSNVTKMRSTFYCCVQLETLDVGGWNTSNVTDFYKTFFHCFELTTIYGGAGWDTSAVTDDNEMFANCNKLCGSSGTTYDADHIGCAYAHLDGGPSNPGYFSPRSYSVWVGSTEVTSANFMSLPVASGSASYNIPYKTLTLNNVTINVTNQADYCIGNGLSVEQRVQGIDGLKIQVNGQCKLNSTGIAMMINGDTQLTGTGKLTINGSTAVWIEEYSGLQVAVKEFYGKATKEVINGDGGITIDGTTLQSFICEPTTTGIYNTIEGLSGMSLNNCHFTDPYIDGKWRYGDVHRFNYWKSNYLRYGLGDYRDKVVIETDANPLKYRLWVGGIRVTSANKDNIDGLESGTATFDPITHTLTLNDATIHTYGYEDGINNGLIENEIDGMPDFKIVCNGTNSMEIEEGSGLVLNSDATISGDRLGIRAWDKGIHLGDFKTLEIQGADVYVEASYPIYCDYNTFVYVRDSQLELEPTGSENPPVYGAREFGLFDCKYKYPGGDINPDWLYYNEQKEMMYYDGDVYTGTLLVVPTGSGISTNISEADTQSTTDQPMYNLEGQRVGKDYKGIVIYNGKKRIVK